MERPNIHTASKGELKAYLRKAIQAGQFGIPAEEISHLLAMVERLAGN